MSVGEGASVNEHFNELENIVFALGADDDVVHVTIGYRRFAFRILGKYSFLICPHVESSEEHVQWCTHDYSISPDIHVTIGVIKGSFHSAGF